MKRSVITLFALWIFLAAGAGVQAKQPHKQDHNKKKSFKHSKLPEPPCARKHGIKASGGRMYVLNKQGTRVFVIERGKGLVRVINLFDFPGSDSAIMEVNAGAGIIYLAYPEARSILFFSDVYNSFMLIIKLDFSPSNMYFDRDTGVLYTYGSNGEIALFDGSTGNRITSDGQTGSANSFDFLDQAGGELVGWNADGNHVCVFDRPTLENCLKIDAGGNISSVALSKSQTRIFIATDAGHLVVKDLGNGTTIKDIPGMDASQILIDDQAHVIYALDTDKNLLFVMDSSSFEVIDTISNREKIDILASFDDHRGVLFLDETGITADETLLSNEQIPDAGDPAVADAEAGHANAYEESPSSTDLAQPPYDEDFFVVGIAKYTNSPCNNCVAQYESAGNDLFYKSTLGSISLTANQYLIDLGLGDWNGDQKIDVVDLVYNWNDNYWTINTFENAGASTFVKKFEYANSYDKRWKITLMVDDFTMDGLMDFQILGTENLINEIRHFITRFTNNGNGGFVDTHQNLEIPVDWSNAGVFYFPLSAKVDDFNLDGQLDILVGFYYAGVYLFTAKADGSFETPVMLSDVTINPINLTADDFDNDGLPDFIVNGNLYKGLGAGAFADQGQVYDWDHIWTYPGGKAYRTELWHAGSYDFNGDGNVDIASTAVEYIPSSPMGSWEPTYGNRVHYFPGNGDGTFGQPLYAGANYKKYVQNFAPLPNDYILGSTKYYSIRGLATPPAIRPRLIVADAGPDRSMFLGDTVVFDGSGSSAASGTISIYAWDFGDGASGGGVQQTHTYSKPGLYIVTLTITDSQGRIARDTAIVRVKALVQDRFVVTGNAAGELLLHLFDAQGQFQPFMTLDNTGSRTWNVTAGDFDGDVDLDVVAMDSSGAVHLYLNRGAPEFTKSVIANLTLNGMAVGGVAGDFNGDTFLDFAFANRYQVFTFLNNGDATFNMTTTSVPGIRQMIFALAVGDFDEDGHQDLLMTDRDNIILLPGTGSGSWQSPVILMNAPARPFALAAADFNEDGDLDFLCGGSGRAPVVYLGNGKGGFTALPSASESVPGDYAAAVYDITGDGHADVALASRQRTNLSVLAGRGDGAFETLMQAAPAIGDSLGVACPPHVFMPRPPPAQSFVILTNENGEIFRSDLQVGAPPLADVKVGQAGDKPGGAGVADFDRDGDYDFVVADGAGRVTLFTNDGAQSFTPSVVADGLDMNGKSQAMAVADINGDLAPDFVFSGNNHTLYVAVNTGGGGFQISPMDVPGAMSLFGKDLADMDGDGDADLVIGEEHAVLLLSGDGDGSFGSPQPLFDVPEAEPRLVLSGDFNGDGIADLITGGESERGDFRAGQGGGVFAPPLQSYELDHVGEHSGDAFDHDGDGIADLSIAARDFSHFYLKGLGGGTFAPPVLISHGALMVAAAAPAAPPLQPLPDLVVHSWEIQAVPVTNPAPGDPVTIRLVVRNEGPMDVPLPPGNTVDLRLTDPASGNVIGSAYGIPYNLLKSGDSVTVDIPIGSFPDPGLHILRAEVDLFMGGLVTEIEETTNNQSSFSFWVGTPQGPEFIDVTCGLNFTQSPGTVRVSGHAQYRVDWTPPEFCADNAVTVKLWHEGEGFINEWSRLTNAPSLATNRSGNYSWAFARPTAPGLYTVFVDVYDNSVHGYCDASFSNSAYPPDISVMDLAMSPSSCIIVNTNGTTGPLLEPAWLRLTADVFNVGNMDACCNIPVTFTAQRDGQGPVELESRVIPNLLVSEGHELTAPGVLYDFDAPGCVNFTMHANPDNTTPVEDKTTNNACSRRLCMNPCKDLVPRNLRIGTNPPVVGDNIIVRGDVGNIGNIPVDAPFNIQLSESAATPQTWPAISVPPDVAPGEFRDGVSLAGAGPSFWTAPAYDARYLEFSVDTAAPGIAECVETNNILRLTLPDLVARDVRPSGSTSCLRGQAEAGIPMNGFSVTVDNTGQMAAADYDVLVTITGPNGYTFTSNPGDIQFPGQGTYTVLAGHTFPFAGQYAVTVTVDPLAGVARPNRVPEQDNTSNNTRTAAFTVREPSRNLGVWAGSHSAITGYVYGPALHDLFALDTPVDSTGNCPRYTAPAHVRATLFNRGSLDAGAPFTTQLVDNRLIAFNTYNTFVQDTRNYNDLAACAQDTQVYEWTPREFMQYIEFQADPPLATGGVITDETREDDNRVRRSLIDLEPVIVTFAPNNQFVPGSPAAGAPIDFYLTYKTTGQMPFPDFDVRAVIVGDGACMTGNNLSYTVFPGMPGPDAHGASYAGVWKHRLASYTFPRCGYDYTVQVCAILDNVPGTGGSCVPERNRNNNCLGPGCPSGPCVPFLIHEPRPDVTPWRDIFTQGHHQHPLDVTLRGLADTTQPVRNQLEPDLLWVEVRNIGEAATQGRVLVDLWTDGTYRQSRLTVNPIPVGGSETVVFSWQPLSNFHQVVFKIDDDSFFPCVANPWGCEREYNDQFTGNNDNETDRDLPELEAVDIKSE